MSTPQGPGGRFAVRARRALVGVACLGSLAGCEPSRTETDAMALERDPRPNILLLMAEDLSPRLGAYGDSTAHTPHLDRLAEEGVRYSRAFTTAGVCAPSRAALITGLHQNVWGAGHMRSAQGGYAAAPPPEVRAFPELLRAAGYYTVNDGKTDYQMGLRFGGALGGPETPWDEAGSSDWSGRDPGQPFFLHLNFMQTHESQVWPTWQLPRSLGSLLLWPVRLWMHSGWVVRTDPASVTPPPYYPDTPIVRADLARHYDNIAALDAKVGEVLARLEADGLAENTVVIFMSDHGDGLPRAKRWLYDSGLHVPLLVRWPGVLEVGGVSDRLVSGIDLAPTVLAAAGLSRPDWMEGRVFAGPESDPPPAYVYAARDRIDEQADRVRGVRDGRYKYLRHDYPERPYVLPIAFRDEMPMMREMLRLEAQGELGEAASLWFRDRRDPEELFDTSSDPHELRNLVDAPEAAVVLARMRGALDGWLARHEDLGLLPEASLRERFFPDGEQPVTAPPRVVMREGLAQVHVSSMADSAEYRRDDDRWRLYTQPVALSLGERLRVRAQRHGWQMSDVVTLTREE